MNGTLQDRLVKEMRLERISDIASANIFLEKHFLPALNRKFAVKARETTDVHRSMPAGMKLDEVLSFQEKRTVSNDWCVMWRNRIFQLDRRHEAMALAGREVTVREKLDGTIQLLNQGHKLHWKELQQRPQKTQPKLPAKNNKKWKPAADHPWNRDSARRAAGGKARSGYAEASLTPRNTLAGDSSIATEMVTLLLQRDSASLDRLRRRP
jgi:hypothetical protein